MSFLDRKQAECPNFFCTVAINKNCNLLNVFWPYARSRADHQLFGDIVTFDTTYLTNKYKMPFSPIVGVNNFGQSILFGCALLSDEIIDTYEWLFNKWLVCFAGKAPDAIIIDQCQSICGAIERVFPKSRHRLCAWHILGKVTKKLGGIFGKHAISTKVLNVVYESEFENRWAEIYAVIKHKLKDTKWFDDIYELRRKWVPLFVNNKFWPQMSTTQRSEPIKAFFNAFITKTALIRNFMPQVDHAHRKLRYNDEEEDLRCTLKWMQTSSRWPYETQFTSLYTFRIFQKFQNELLQTMNFSCWINDQPSNDCVSYKVRDVISERETTVIVNRHDQNYFCNCLMSNATASFADIYSQFSSKKAYLFVLKIKYARDGARVISRDVP